MLETALAQLRLAASLVFGVRLAPWSLDALVEAARATRHEFGGLGAEGAEIVAGPTLDERARRDMQQRRFRGQARRAGRETRYYARRFAELGLDATHLPADATTIIPPTPKDALRDDPDAFVRWKRRPVLRAMTTGTTGRPTAVSFGADELRCIVALSALGLLIGGNLAPEDVVQISTSARATLGNLGLAGAAARIGAEVHLAGVIEPEAALTLLTAPRVVDGRKPRASVLSTYPSYLGELVEWGLEHGYGPADFGVENIFLGGELVTAGLRARCERLFGPVRLAESYAMTETIPFGGTRCEAGHLHFAPARGLLEVLNPDTGTPALPGEAGSIVATPFAPFRETTLLLRYDTEDMVRVLDEPLTCSLRGVPATSYLLGKRRLAVRHDDGWVFPRAVLEACEGLDEVPLPARCGFWAVPGGVAVEVCVRQVAPSVRRAVAQSLEAHGVPLRELTLVEDPGHLCRPLPLRADLKEVSFAARPTGRVSEEIASGPLGARGV